MQAVNTKEVIKMTRTKKKNPTQSIDMLIAELEIALERNELTPDEQEEFEEILTQLNITNPNTPCQVCISMV